MIHFFQPSSIQGRLGDAYNHYASLVTNPNDWICFTDFDVMLFPAHCERGIQHAIDTFPHFDLFTCWATRVGGKQQRYKGNISEERDIVKLKLEAEACYKHNYGKVTELHKFISGHFMLFKRSLWDHIKFPTETKQGTILGIDNVWSHRVLKNGYRIARIDYLLAVHYYRLDKGRHYREHLKQFG